MKTYILQGIREGNNVDILGAYSSLPLLVVACRDYQLALRDAGALVFLPKYLEYRYTEVTTERVASIHMSVLVPTA